MKKYKIVNLLQEEEIFKKRGNIFFGCNKCKHEYNADDYADNTYHEGLACPKCQSKNLVAL